MVSDQIRVTQYDDHYDNEKFYLRDRYAFIYKIFCEFNSWEPNHQYVFEDLGLYVRLYPYSHRVSVTNHPILSNNKLDKKFGINFKTYNLVEITLEKITSYWGADIFNYTSLEKPTMREIDESYEMRKLLVGL